MSPSPSPRSKPPKSASCCLGSRLRVGRIATWHGRDCAGSVTRPGARRPWPTSSGWSANARSSSTVLAAHGLSHTLQDGSFAWRWGSPAIRSNRIGLRFAPGSIGSDRSRTTSSAATTCSFSRSTGGAARWSACTRQFPRVRKSSLIHRTRIDGHGLSVSVRWLRSRRPLPSEWKARSALKAGFLYTYMTNRRGRGYTTLLETVHPLRARVPRSSLFRKSTGRKSATMSYRRYSSSAVMPARPPCWSSPSDSASGRKKNLPHGRGTRAAAIPRMSATSSAARYGWSRVSPDGSGGPTAAARSTSMAITSRRVVALARRIDPRGVSPRSPTMRLTASISRH